MGILEDINKGPLESLIDDKVKEARGRDLLRGAFIQGQAPVDTSLLKKEDFVDPVMALPRDLAKKGGVGNLLKSVAAGSLGLLGDLGSIFPGAQNSIAGQAPTTEDLGEKFGADFSRPGGMLGMVGAPDPGDIARLGGKGLLAMTLFHGTPHRFDKFALDKIGTGEGAQAYGHGLYFAENPGVAKSYQQQLARFTDSVRIDGKESDLLSHFDPIERKVLEKSRDRLDIDSWNDIVERELIPEIRVKMGLKKSEFGRVEAVGGHIYEVEIPDEITDRMLDWDAPLSEQPESVQQILNNALDETLGTDGASQLRFTRNLQGDDIKQSVYSLRSNDATGEQIYDYLASHHGERAPIVMGSNAGNMRQGPAAASDRLSELGIPGIRFFDGSSRTRPDWQGIINKSLQNDPYYRPEQLGKVIDHEGYGIGRLDSSTLRQTDVTEWVVYDKKGKDIEGFERLKDAKEWIAKHPSTDKGTRNIVVFNPDDITQVKRDGELVFENKSGLKPDKAASIASDLAEQL